jgi:hypothetical protein
MTLYDKLPADTRDAILCEAAAYSTMLEGMEDGAAMLRKKAAKLRRNAQEGRVSSSSKNAVSGRRSS